MEVFQQYLPISSLVKTENDHDYATNDETHEEASTHSVKEEYTRISAVAVEPAMHEEKTDNFDEFKKDDDNAANLDNIKDEIEIDETPIQLLKNDFPWDIADGSVKQEVKTENLDEFREEDKNADTSDDIKDEIEIDGTSIQLLKNDFPWDVVVGSVKQEVKTEKFDELGEEDENADPLDNIKDEIDVDETRTQFLKNDFPWDIAVGSVKQEVKTEKFDELGEEDENADTLDNFKDEIDIDETPIQFLKNDFPWVIAVSSVKQEVKTENLDEFGEEDKKADNIKDEIEIDETPIQLLKNDFPWDIAIGSVKQEVKTDKFDEFEKEDDNDANLDNIKEEIEIVETPIQLLKNDFPWDIAAGSVKQEVKIENLDEFGEEDKKADTSDNIKDEIEIVETPIQLLKNDLPWDIAIDSVKQEVKTEKFDELGEEDKNADTLDNIKDEIDIDETPIQLLKNGFPWDVAVGSVKQEADSGNDGNVHFKSDDIKHEIDETTVSSCDEEFFKGFAMDPIKLKVESGNDDYVDFNAGDIKTDIDIDETPISFFKEELFNGFAEHPFLLEKEQNEPSCSGESQLSLDLEFKLFGRVAVVSLSRFEHEATNIDRSCPDSRNLNHNVPSVETDTCHSPRNTRSLLKSLRKYRTSKSRVKQNVRELKQSSNAETIQNSRNTEMFLCMLCSFSCATKTSLEIHSRRHTGKKRVCSDCGYKASSSTDLLKHSRIHTGNKPHKCDVCDCRFARKSHLVDHRRRHTGDKPYECDLCDYKCAQKSTLTYHKRVNSGKKPFRCSLCNSTFCRLSALKDHERSHNRDEQPYSCTMCDYKSFSSKLLSDHRRIHKRIYIKRFSCEMCDFKCYNMAKLIEHRRIHTGEKPYKCETCGYRATRFGHLKLHIRTHTNEKPYCCDECDYKCASSCGLINHKRTHTSEKPYSCDLCSYKASQLRTLRWHKSLRHKKK